MASTTGKARGNTQGSWLAADAGNGFEGKSEINVLAIGNAALNAAAMIAACADFSVFHVEGIVGL